MSKRKKPKQKKPRKLSDAESAAVELDELLTADEAAQLVDSSRRMLCRLAAEGRVPFAEQVGTRWTFTKASVVFLKEHWARDAKENRLWAGETARKEMLRAAAKLDPACRARQKSHIPQYWKRKQEAS